MNEQIISGKDLFKLINDGTIKKDTKLDVYKGNSYITTIVFDGYDFLWESGMFNSGLFFDPTVNFKVENKIIEKIEIEEDILFNSFIKNKYGAKCSIKSHDKVIIEKLNEVIDYINEKEKENEVVRF